MNLDKIKIDRLSEPEKFILDKFDGLVEYTEDDCPYLLFYKKDDELLFTFNQSIKTIYYSFYSIHVVFRDNFKYDYDNTCKLIQSMVEQHFNLKMSTITYDWF